MPLVKICGVTTVEQAMALVKLGVRVLGLNFYPKSPRCISIERAEEILGALSSSVTTLGVFVSGNPLREFPGIERLRLTGWQTYSDVPATLPANRIGLHIPAFRVANREHLEKVESHLLELKAPSSALLIDSYVPGEMGGTGHVAPWELLADWKCPTKLWLAGGLTPENVAGAIRTVKPWGVDVASGVESAPGVKDLEKVKAFLDAVDSA